MTPLYWIPPPESLLESGCTSVCANPTDTDRDGTPDMRDLDSDNDGLSDKTEGTADLDGDQVGNFRDPASCPLPPGVA